MPREALQAPVGAVMSRLSRGRGKPQALMRGEPVPALLAGGGAGWLGRDLRPADTALVDAAVRGHRDLPVGLELGHPFAGGDPNAVTRAPAGSARVTAFHFASIEQGGASLYDQFAPFVSDKTVLRIVSSIYATEAVHYAIFRDSLNGVTAFTSGDGKLVVPNLTEGKQGSAHVMPKRCDFLSQRFPKCSVIRPSSPAKAGARATAAFLAASNLFKGQTPAFFAAVTALANAADGVG